MVLCLRLTGTRMVSCSVVPTEPRPHDIKHTLHIPLSRVLAYEREPELFNPVLLYYSRPAAEKRCSIGSDFVRPRNIIL